MQILTKKRFIFKNGDEKFISAGGMAIETCPDWVAKDALYAAGVHEGSIVEIASHNRAVTEQAIAAAEAETKAAAKPRVRANKPKA